MSYIGQVKEDPRAAICAVLGNVRTAMLGLREPHHLMQPMTMYPDKDGHAIWFLSSTKTDLVKALDSDGTLAELAVISKDHDAHISLLGRLSHLRDEAKVDELWSAPAAIWFEGGRDDPSIALLRFDPTDAQIWASTTSALKFGYEMVRKTMDSDHEPDLGTKADVRF